MLKHSATITPKQRAELILLGNVRLVAYEQRRLQPVLDRNLELLPHALRLRVVTEWFGRNDLRTRAATRAYQIASPLFPRRRGGVPDRSHSPRVPDDPWSGATALRCRPAASAARPTRYCGRTNRPTTRTATPKSEFFPYDLQTIEHPALWAEWQQHDRSFGQGERTAVDNWLRLPERMNFIVNVFRSRQQLCALYERPSATPAATIQNRPVLGPVRGSISTGRSRAAPVRSPLMRRHPPGARRDEPGRRRAAARSSPRPRAMRRRRAADASSSVVTKRRHRRARADRPRAELLPAVMMRVGQGRHGELGSEVRELPLRRRRDQRRPHDEPRTCQASAELLRRATGCVIITALFHASLPEAYLGQARRAGPRHHRRAVPELDPSSAGDRSVPHQRAQPDPRPVARQHEQPDGG